MQLKHSLVISNVKLLGRKGSNCSVYLPQLSTFKYMFLKELFKNMDVQVVFSFNSCYIHLIEVCLSLSSLADRTSSLVYSVGVHLYSF